MDSTIHLFIDPFLASYYFIYLDTEDKKKARNQPTTHNLTYLCTPRMLPSSLACAPVSDVVISVSVWLGVRAYKRPRKRVGQSYHDLGGTQHPSAFLLNVFGLLEYLPFFPLLLSESSAPRVQPCLRLLMTQTAPTTIFLCPL